MAKILDTARTAGTFKTLVTAIEAAGLEDTLSAEGPFTVFAPSDDAFSRLPAGTVEGLLEDEEKLRAVLTYHVVPGRILAAEVPEHGAVTTVNGASLNVRRSNGSVRVGEARVTDADLAVDNGVIHVIDSVLIPG